MKIRLTSCAEAVRAMSTIRNITPVVRRYYISQEPTGFAYWQSQPYAARLAALEEIRREYHRWKYHAEPRLQRVYSIAKR